MMSKRVIGWGCWGDVLGDAGESCVKELQEGEVGGRCMRCRRGRQKGDGDVG